MKIRIAAGVLAVAAGAMAAPAMAGYFGVGAAQNKVDDWNAGVIDDGSFASYSVEDTDTGFRLYGGFEINESFTFEIGYSDFGEATASGDSDGSGFYWSPGPVSVTLEGTGIDLGFAGKASVSPNFAVLGRLGLLLWDYEYSERDSTDSFSFSDDGNDPFFGIGVEFKTSETLALRGEFVRYSIDDLDVDSLAVSLVLQGGGGR